MNNNNIIKVLLETGNGVKNLSTPGMIKILLNTPDTEMDNIIKTLQESHNFCDEIFYVLFITGGVDRYPELYDKYNESLIVAYALKIGDSSITAEEVLGFLDEINFSSPVTEDPVEICWNMSLFGPSRNFMDLWREQVKGTGSRVFGPDEISWMKDKFYNMNSD